MSHASEMNHQSRIKRDIMNGDYTDYGEDVRTQTPLYATEISMNHKPRLERSRLSSLASRDLKSANHSINDIEHDQRTLYDDQHLSKFHNILRNNSSKYIECFDGDTDDRRNSGRSYNKDMRGIPSRYEVLKRYNHSRPSNSRRSHSSASSSNRNKRKSEATLHKIALTQISNILETADIRNNIELVIYI